MKSMNLKKSMSTSSSPNPLLLLQIAQIIYDCSRGLSVFPCRYNKIKSAIEDSVFLISHIQELNTQNKWPKSKYRNTNFYMKYFFSGKKNYGCKPPPMNLIH